ncbi:restriction endonuclease subunit S [Clostridium botulinum]|nr:restriction endonuclease subunit S [Clostridium botulinum]
MFGDPITNPKGWTVSKLGGVCSISRGGSPRPIDSFLGGSIPWIKIGDATKGDDIYINKTKEGIIEEGVRKSRLIKKGGLIFANCGVSLGFARILKIDGCIHDGWLAFEDFEKYLDKIFFLKSLNYCTEYFRRTAPDGTQPNLNTGIMREYIQIVPPMELQQEFSKFIEQVDKLKFKIQENFNLYYMFVMG